MIRIKVLELYMIFCLLLIIQCFGTNQLITNLMKQFCSCYQHTYHQNNDLVFRNQPYRTPQRETPSSLSNQITRTSQSVTTQMNNRLLDSEQHQDHTERHQNQLVEFYCEICTRTFDALKTYKFHSGFCQHMICLECFFQHWKQEESSKAQNCVMCNVRVTHPLETAVLSQDIGYVKAVIDAAMNTMGGIEKRYIYEAKMKNTNIAIGEILGRVVEIQDIIRPQDLNNIDPFTYLMTVVNRDIRRARLRDRLLEDDEAIFYDPEENTFSYRESVEERIRRERGSAGRTDNELF